MVLRGTVGSESNFAASIFFPDPVMRLAWSRGENASHYESLHVLYAKLTSHSMFHRSAYTVSLVILLAKVV